MALFFTVLPYLTCSFLGAVGGWYGHRKFGTKAQAVVDAVKGIS